jgi:hypothetical protein
MLTRYYICRIIERHMALKRDFSQHGSDAGKRFVCCMEIPVDHPSGIGGTGATLIDKLPLIGQESDVPFHSDNEVR